MILADTSVWVDHLRAGDADLVALLNGSRVLMHPFVLGELACVSQRSPDEVKRNPGNRSGDSRRAVSGRPWILRRHSVMVLRFLCVKRNMRLKHGSIPTQ